MLTPTAEPRRQANHFDHVHDACIQGHDTVVKYLFDNRLGSVYRVTSMSVAYYIGAKAIAERLGYKNTKTVTRWAERDGLPIYKRRYPLKTGGFVTKWSISESAMTAWELVQGQRSVHMLQAKKALKAEQRARALTA